MKDSSLLESRPLLSDSSQATMKHEFAKASEAQNIRDSSIDLQNRENPFKNDHISNDNSKSAKELFHKDPHVAQKIENKASSDKSFKFEKDDNNIQEQFFKLLHKVEGLSTYAALGANFLGAILMQLALPDKFKRIFSKLVDGITNTSFIPYGLDGARIGWKEKNNLYQAFGFILETSTVWLSDIKTKYLIRGAGTGTDQIWVATDKKLEEKYGIKDGCFKNWYEGFIKVPETCWELLGEVFKDPIGTIFTTDSKGHKALLSSIGDIISTLGYAFGGNEKFFGSIRDFAGALMDFELLFDKLKLRKIAGALFITESTFDFIARFAKTEWSRLTLNMLAHASGRAALMTYKNSDPNANRDKESIFDFKPIATDKQLNTNKTINPRGVSVATVA